MTSPDRRADNNLLSLLTFLVTFVFARLRVFFRSSGACDYAEAIEERQSLINPINCGR